MKKIPISILFSRASFTKVQNRRIGKRPAIFKMGKLESLDIDNYEDFQLAELLHGQQLNNSNL